MTNIDRLKNTLLLNDQAQNLDGSDEAGRQAMDRLFSCTVDELRRIAHALMRDERSGNLLQPTALVNEAYLRLFDLEKVSVQGRAHFMNMAARIMRRVLVDQARKRNAQKRGAGWQPVTLTGIPDRSPGDQLDLLALDRALEGLTAIDQRAAEVVELRVFGGLTMEEVAEQMSLTRRTIQKDWRFATMWLRREMEGRSIL